MAISTGGTVGLSEMISDETCLVLIGLNDGCAVHRTHALHVVFIYISNAEIFFLAIEKTCF